MGARLHTDLRMAPAQVLVEKRSDGSILMRSPHKLGAHARAVGEWLQRWAAEAPERTFLAERAADGWRKLGYRETLDAVRRVGRALLERRLDASRPVAILSDNGIDHALLALGAMHVGVPVAPISPAYSLMSKDFAKLKTIFELKSGYARPAELGGRYRVFVGDHGFAQAIRRRRGGLVHVVYASPSVVVLRDDRGAG